MVVGRGFEDRSSRSMWLEFPYFDVDVSGGHLLSRVPASNAPLQLGAVRRVNDLPAHHRSCADKWPSIL